RAPSASEKAKTRQSSAPAPTPTDTQLRVYIFHESISKSELSGCSTNGVHNWLNSPLAKTLCNSISSVQGSIMLRAVDFDSAEMFEERLYLRLREEALLWDSFVFPLTSLMVYAVNVGGGKSVKARKESTYNAHTSSCLGPNGLIAFRRSALPNMDSSLAEYLLVFTEGYSTGFDGRSSRDTDHDEPGDRKKQKPSAEQRTQISLIFGGLRYGEIVVASTLNTNTTFSHVDPSTKLPNGQFPLNSDDLFLLAKDAHGRNERNGVHVPTSDTHDLLLVPRHGHAVPWPDQCQAPGASGKGRGGSFFVGNRELDCIEPASAIDVPESGSLVVMVVYRSSKDELAGPSTGMGDGFLNTSVSRAAILRIIADLQVVHKEKGESGFLFKLFKVKLTEAQLEFIVTAAVKKAMELVPATARANVEQLRRDVSTAMKTWQSVDVQNFLQNSSWPLGPGGSSSSSSGGKGDTPAGQIFSHYPGYNSYGHPPPIYGALYGYPAGPGYGHYVPYGFPAPSPPYGCYPSSPPSTPYGLYGGEYSAPPQFHAFPTGPHPHYGGPPPPSHYGTHGGQPPPSHYGTHGGQPPPSHYG
ncbi:hypothetical protein B484DRAFT_125598, partial [Ochromonadaceae sp. CCMP2298]